MKIEIKFSIKKTRSFRDIKNVEKTWRIIIHWTEYDQMDFMWVNVLRVSDGDIFPVCTRLKFNLSHGKIIHQQEQP